MRIWRNRQTRMVQVHMNIIRAGSTPVIRTSVVCLMGHGQFSKKLDYQFLVI